MAEQFCSKINFDKVKGVIFGQAIGDAFGLATEFLTDLKSINMYYPNGVNTFSDIIQDNHRSAWKIGDWTDDTDLCILGLLDFVENKGHITITTLAKKFQMWYKHGIPELGDVTSCGIGNTVSSILKHKDYLFDPIKVARQYASSESNGGIMRIAPMGCINNIQKVVSNCLISVQITHINPHCSVTSIFVSLLIHNILYGGISDELSDECISKTQKMVLEMFPKYTRKINQVVELSRCGIEKLKLRELMGHTYKTLVSGLWAYRNRSLGFFACIQKITMQGGDADTNCAVAGAVLGAYVGYSGLPENLKNTLIYKDYLTKVSTDFYNAI